MSNARNLANFLGTSTTVPSGKIVTASLPTGSVLQVVQGSLKSAFTGTGASGYADGGSGIVVIRYLIS